eukprot:Awhi_evm1s4188
MSTSLSDLHIKAAVVPYTEDGIIMLETSLENDIHFPTLDIVLDEKHNSTSQLSEVVKRQWVQFCVEKKVNIKDSSDPDIALTDSESIKDFIDEAFLQSLSLVTCYVKTDELKNVNGVNVVFTLKCTKSQIEQLSHCVYQNKTCSPSTSFTQLYSPPLSPSSTAPSSPTTTSTVSSRDLFPTLSSKASSKASPSFLLDEESLWNRVMTKEEEIQVEDEQDTTNNTAIAHTTTTTETTTKVNNNDNKKYSDDNSISKNNNKKELTFDSGDYWLLEDYDQLDPCNYIYHCSKGKQIRKRFVDKLSREYSIDTSDVRALNTCIERFHAVSLLLDDIEDDSTMRRGKTCAHLVYGTPLTINAAYMSIFWLIDMVPKLFHSNHVATQQLIMNTCVEIHRGQGLDILWRDSNYCPTELEYIDMVKGKTSAAFVLAGRIFCLHSSDYRLFLGRWGSKILGQMVTLMNTMSSSTRIGLVAKKAVVQTSSTISQVISNIPVIGTTVRSWSDWLLKGYLSPEERIALLFDKIGVFFQIRDDYINLTDEKYWEQK